MAKVCSFEAAMGWERVVIEKVTSAGCTIVIATGQPRNGFRDNLGSALLGLRNTPII